MVQEAAVVSSPTKKEHARNTKMARAPQQDGFLNANLDVCTNGWFTNLDHKIIIMCLPSNFYHPRLE